MRASRALPLGAAMLAALLTSAGCWRAGPASSPAEASGIGVSVRGVAGPVLKGRARRFLAVDVIVDNPTEQDSRGVVRVYRVARPGDPTPEQALYYERRVDLPRQSRRIETLYYYCQDEEVDDRLCAAYLPDEGPAPPPVFPPLRMLGAEPLVLVVSSRPDDAEGRTRLLRQTRLAMARRPLQPVIEKAEPGALPEHLAGYDPFDAVLVTDLDPDALPPREAEALLDWVAAGGDLIVSASGQRGELERSPLLPALPIERPAGAHQVQERTLAGLSRLAPEVGPPPRDRVLVDQVQPAPGAEVLAGDAQGPLVIRGRHGAGRVTYLAFPLDAGPLRGWDGAGTFAAALLRPAREDLDRDRDIPPAPPLEELLLNLSEALEALTPPSALIVAPLLILYVALVAPINYLVLSRRNRLGLAQLTAAGVVVVFGLLFWGLGLLYKGTDSLATQVALVEVPTRPGKARVEVMTGHYSTDRGLSAAAGPPGAVVGPVAEERTHREARVVQGDDRTRLEGLTLSTYSLRRFRSLRAEDVGYITGDLRLVGKGEKLALAGAIHNRTQLPLESPALLFEGYLLDLAAIEPGAALDLGGSRTADVTGSPEFVLPQGSLPAQVVADARGRYSPRYGLGFSAGLQIDPYGDSKPRRVLAALQRRLARVPRSPGTIPALLVARSPRDPGGVVVEGNARTVLSRTIVLCELEVRVDPGLYALRHLEPRVDRQVALAPTSGRTGSPPVLGGIGTPGGAEWSWYLPASRERPAQLQQLSFRWALEPQPIPNMALIEAWDHALGDWRPLLDPGAELLQRGRGEWPPRDRSGQQVRAPQDLKGRQIDPRDLVHPSSGRVRLRMSTSGTDLAIRTLELDADVRIAGE